MGRLNIGGNGKLGSLLMGHKRVCKVRRPDRFQKLPERGEVVIGVGEKQLSYEDSAETTHRNLLTKV